MKSIAPSIRSAATQARFSRRAVLAHLGVGAGVLPLLHAERAIGATASGFPKRLITIAWTNGVAQPHYYPAGDDPTTGEVLKPFVPLKAKVLLPCGIDIKVMLDTNHQYDGHFSYPSLFTGTYKNMGGQASAAAGPSIDQVVSDAIAKQVSLPVPLLNLAAGTSRSTSFRSDAQRNTPETDPLRLHGRLFTGKNVSTDQVDALRNRRKSILDFLGKDLTAYSARLGTEDRVKIAAHMESLRQIETQLAAKPKGSCESPAAPAAGGDYATKVKLFCEMTALAMRCDITRVAAMAWGDDGGSGPQSFSHIGISADYHGIAHKGPPGYAEKIKIDTWLFQQVANLAKLLDDTQESGGTALDHSVIVAANDMNEGNGHAVGALPFLIVGSGGGYFKTGRAVRLGTWATKSGEYWKSNSGVANNKLLAAVGNAMDVPMDSFGAAGYGGVLTELSK